MVKILNASGNYNKNDIKKILDDFTYLKGRKSRDQISELLTYRITSK
jgi:hypothetical protein